MYVGILIVLPMYLYFYKGIKLIQSKLTLSSVLVTTCSNVKFLFSSFSLSTAVLNIITSRSNFAVRFLSVTGESESELMVDTPLLKLEFYFRYIRYFIFTNIEIYIENIQIICKL